MPKPHQVKKTEPFDEFFKKVNKGRAYRCQALELIKICRIFSAGPEQPFHGEHFLRDAKLQEVLKECDLTIARAIDSRGKLREDTGLPFERATRKLREYASKFHLSLKDINKDMRTAKDRDQKRMDQDKMRMNKPILSQHTEPEESPKTVEFHILESLPYKDPVIVHQAILGISDEPELEFLWNFMHPDVGGLLTLSQNPHFYKPLPVFPNAYRGMSDRQLVLKDYESQGHICVLKNNERRVFLECCKETRTFDNVWVVNDLLIFRDISGKLEGETEVGPHQHARFCSRVVFRPSVNRQELEPVCQTPDWRTTVRELWDSHTLMHFSLRTQ